MDRADKAIVTPGALLEMRVGIDGPCDGHPSGSAWIPVEVVSLPASEECGSCGKDKVEVFIRTWPGKAWSAIWTPLQNLRKPELENND